MGPKYRLGKGPVIVQLEEWLSKAENVRTLRQELFDRREYNDDKYYDDAASFTTFERYLKEEHGDDYKHLELDVFGEFTLFGELETPASLEQRQRGRERRRVYCEAVRAALELALEITSEESTPAPRAVETVPPIEFFWGCGQPANRCWVSWSGEKERRRITVIVQSDAPAMAWDPNQVSAIEAFPASAAGPTGMVVFEEEIEGEVRSSVADEDLGVPTTPQLEAMVAERGRSRSTYR